MKKEFKIGLFSVVAIVMLYIGVKYLRGIDFFSSSKRYYAVYHNIDKLAVSNPVYLSGFAVGRVSDISIMQKKDNLIIVEIEIDNTINLTDSTRAILSSDLLGGKSIQLKIPPGAPVIKAGDTLIAQKERGMLDTFSETAEPVATNLQSTLRKLGLVLDNMATTAKQVENILRNLNATPHLLNKALGNANEKMNLITDEMRLMSGKIIGIMDTLRPTLSNAKTISDSLRQIPLRQTIVQARNSLLQLTGVLEKLQKPGGTAGKLMTDPQVYDNLNRLMLRFDTLIKNFNDNPKHFLAPLGKRKNKIQRDRERAAE